MRILQSCRVRYIHASGTGADCLCRPVLVCYEHFMHEHSAGMQAEVRSALRTPSALCRRRAGAAWSDTRPRNEVCKGKRAHLTRAADGVRVQHRQPRVVDVAAHVDAALAEGLEAAALERVALERLFEPRVGRAVEDDATAAPMHVVDDEDDAPAQGIWKLGKVTSAVDGTVPAEKSKTQLPG
jgi:hypothetical protein